MTYTIVDLIRRKQDITPEQFRNYYNNVHVPLLKLLMGDTFPLTHTRHYVSRILSESKSGPDVQTVSI